MQPRGQLLRETWNPGYVGLTRGDDDGAGFPTEPVGLDAVAKRRGPHRQHRGAGLDRCARRSRIVGEITGELGRSHIAVGIVAMVRPAGKPGHPVRRQQSQRIPPLAAPALGNLPALQHGMLDAVLHEAMTHRQSGLAGADDDDWNVVHGLLPGLNSPATASPFREMRRRRELRVTQTSTSIVTGTCPVRMS